MSIVTNASKEDWVGHMGDWVDIRQIWHPSVGWIKCHINWLELQAVWLTINNLSLFGWCSCRRPVCTTRLPLPTSTNGTGCSRLPCVAYSYECESVADSGGFTALLPTSQKVNSLLKINTYLQSLPILLYPPPCSVHSWRCYALMRRRCAHAQTGHIYRQLQVLLLAGLVWTSWLQVLWG